MNLGRSCRDDHPLLKAPLILETQCLAPLRSSLVSDLGVADRPRVDENRPERKGIKRLETCQLRKAMVARRTHDPRRFRKNAPARGASSMRRGLGLVKPVSFCFVRATYSRRLCISNLSVSRYTSLSAASARFLASSSFIQTRPASCGLFSIAWWSQRKAPRSLAPLA